MPEGKLPPDFAIVVVPTIVIFLAIFASPWWYNAAFGDTAYRPEPAIAAGAGSQCLLERAEIRTEHMALLDAWRDEAVREGLRRRDEAMERGKRVQVDVERAPQFMDKSLTNTCLGCHSNREQFCDVCHSYAGEDPYCWDCHVDSAKAPRREGSDQRVERREAQPRRVMPPRRQIKRRAMPVEAEHGGER